MKKRAFNTQIIKFLILAIFAILPTADAFAENPGGAGIIKGPGKIKPPKDKKHDITPVKPILTVNGNDQYLKFSFDAGGGTRELTISTNQGTPEVVSLPSWLSVVGSTSEMILRCLPNTSAYDRDADFRIQAGKKSVSVHVSQPTGRITITKCEFINTDEFSSKISGPSNRMHHSDIRYLNPVLTYNGPGKSQQKTLYVKIYDSRGHLRTTTRNATDYTFKDVVTFFPGKDQTVTLMGLGSPSESVFSTGTVRVEIYCDDELLTSGTIELY